MYDPRQWYFVTDMNYSGLVTISDIWLWFKWLYFYPGDGVIYFLVNWYPNLGRFLEITYSNYGGVLSGIISFVVWIIVALIIVGIFEKAKTEQKKSDLIAAQLRESRMKHLETRTPKSVDHIVKVMNKDDYEYERAKKNILIYKNELEKAGIAEDELTWGLDDCWMRFKFFAKLENPEEYAKKRVHDYLENHKPLY